MGDDLNGKKRFTWDIHWECNYRCPYCWWHGRWQEISAQNCYPGIDKLIATWSRIYEFYGPAHIDISGGEPFIYPDFFKFLSLITNYHSVAINTNLSFDAEKMIQVIPGNRHKIRLNATFHPLFADFDTFVEKAALLQNNNFALGIAYLAWPGQIEDIPLYREEFEKEGFWLCLLTFWGEYNGKKYPGAYTPHEKQIINPNLGERSGENFQVEPIIVQGKMCNAGHTYAAIHPDGKALRCGGGSWEKEDTAVGNLFDDNFKLLTEAKPCISKYCPCNEWAFLLVKDE